MIDTLKLPYGTVPSSWIGSLVIEQLPGTRWYVERGTIVSYRRWLDELHRANSDLIPMTWASLYTGVSRAGFHKRAMAGKLTVFSFYMSEPARTLLGRTVYRESRSSFDYVLKAECAAWNEDLVRRADRSVDAEAVPEDETADGE